MEVLPPPGEEEVTIPKELLNGDYKIEQSG